MSFLADMKTGTVRLHLRQGDDLHHLRICYQGSLDGGFLGDSDCSAGRVRRCAYHSWGFAGVDELVNKA